MEVTHPSEPDVLPLLNWQEALRVALTRFAIPPSKGELPSHLDINLLNQYLSPFSLQAEQRQLNLEEILDLPGMVVLISLSDQRYAVVMVAEDGKRCILIDAAASVMAASTPLSSVLPYYAGEVFILRRQDLATSVLGEQAAVTPNYIAHLRVYWARFVEIGLSSLMTNGLMLMVPLFSMLVYDKIMGNRVMETLWSLALGVSLFILLDFVLRAIRAYYVEQIATASDIALDRVILKRLLQSASTQIPSVGELLNRYKDLTGARDFLSSQYMLAVADLPFLPIFLLVLWAIGGPIVCVPIVIGALTLMLSILLNKPAHDFAVLGGRMNNRKTNLLSDILVGSELVRTSFLKNLFTRRWHALSQAAAQATGRARFWKALNNALNYDAITFNSVVNLVVGVYLVEANMLSVGALIACSMLSNRAIGNMMSVMTLAARFGEFRFARKQFDAINPPAVDSNIEKLPPRSVHGLINLNRVYFKFDGNQRYLLEDINLSIRPGEKVALVGRPGSGKSTLLRLLAGVAPPSAGEVLLDGLALTHYDFHTLAKLRAYKPQQPVFFEGSLEENIRAGWDFVEHKEILRALYLAALDGAISRGDLNLGTAIELRGANLSGGQQQGVALARALVSNASIILLDEPTASLDTATEKLLVERLRDYGKNKTMIIATHSQPLLSIVDRLIVIERGKIVADGPREKIMVAA